MDVTTEPSGETAPVYTEIRMKPFSLPQLRFVADGDQHRQAAQGVAVVRDEDLVEGDIVGDAGSVHFPLEGKWPEGRSLRFHATPTRRHTPYHSSGRMSPPSPSGDELSGGKRRPSTASGR